ncbi:tRNA (adenosine(37)-N6)-threonylcarbamoyltransferase complex dimerization subunit type 1 TsaB [bacterium]|nr:tRNA (adenosine(37)-N6)-threonylcarbamoyltransferase complex dimerization subunit type 1 TsaB [bacterium]
MLTLALDTATAQASIALLRDDVVLAETAAARTTDGDHLFPALRQLLHEQQVDAGAVDLFVIGLGPGSFTGVRAGLAAAKGLALPAGRPLRGVGSFDAIALTALPGLTADCAALCVLGDARRGEIYYAVYDRDGKATVPCRLGALNALADHVHDPIWFVSTEIDRFRQPLRETLGGFAVVADRAVHPRAAWVGKLGRDQFLADGNRGQTGLTPIYLREPAYRKTTNS